jgi:hypothetical protein
VKFVNCPPLQSAGHRNLRMSATGTASAGRCESCATSAVSAASTRSPSGLAGTARVWPGAWSAAPDGPDCTWRTTRQSPQAKLFFPTLEKELGVTFPEYGGVCEHLASPSGYRTPPSARRPRPVLECHI